jgi:uncharacterized repeat protein (TIGR03803 family)
VKLSTSAQVRSIAVLTLLFATLIIASPAQTFTSLANFDGTDGRFPGANALIQGRDGNFYGTTNFGGAFDHGAVYEVTADGTISAFYSFCAQTDCADGDTPLSPLILGVDGNFYGTTEGGGVNQKGNFFKLTPEGTLTNVYNFCSLANCTDGSYPEGPIVLGFDGNFYGTSRTTIYKLTPGGSLTTLHTFCSLANCADGGGGSTLTRAHDGTFYGATSGGGANGSGTVFHLTPAGAFTTLYSFCSLAGCADGETPLGPVAVTYYGDIYGTTFVGGTGSGTIFELAPGGTLKTLYNFCSAAKCVDGAYPEGGLVATTAAHFYGTTSEGGFNNRGTAFQISSYDNHFTRLHSFHSNDGGDPEGAVFEGTDGSIYGTTENGGLMAGVCLNYGRPHGCGTVFSLSMHIPPFVETVQPAGKVGDVITILGHSLTGAIDVTFGFEGKPAKFSVVSDNEISATIPEGAGTAAIYVTMDGWRLQSNIAFHVLP